MARTKIKTNESLDPTAPIDGVIGNRHARVGDYATAGA